MTSFDWPSHRQQLEQRYDEYRAAVAEAFQSDPSGSSAPAWPEPYREAPLADLDTVERMVTVFELDDAPPSLKDAQWASDVDSVLARLAVKIPVVNFAKWSRKPMPYLDGRSVLDIVADTDRERLNKLVSQLLPNS